ncbi:flagellar assembly protein FlbE [Brevundimonas sp.]|uniref:flagellar assembly protein FlbE n=1 Tax=Brevundimonas sp. TaxID=1871086 RepID=UPI0025BFAC8E|nr:flagellar assembly protein FlbE [Brevundimonas sp.]
MSAQPETRAFFFDTEFDAGGEVVRGSSWRPTKRAWTQGEVEALVAQASVEARETALAEIASIQAMALSSIGQALEAAAPALTQIAQAHREQSAELAMAAARVVAAAALDRFPEAPLQAALEALGQEIDASPRLVIRTGDLTDETRARLQQLGADAGFSGIVAFRDEPGLPPAAFRLEWADGRADFDPADAFARMAEALNSALAAEAGHAETLNGRS